MTQSSNEEFTDQDGSSSATNGHAHSVRGLRENARVAGEALRAACRGATDAMTDLGEEAYQVGAKTGANIARRVEAQPMTSVVIAASVGLIAGVLLSRR